MNSVALTRFQSTMEFFKISHIFIFLLFFGAVLSGLLASLDYDTLLSIATNMVVNANPKTHLTTEVHSQLVVKLKYFAIVLFGLSGIVFVFKTQLNTLTSQIKEDSRIFLRDLKCYLKSLFVIENKYELICFVVLCLTGILLRIYYLNQPIRSDEALVFEQFAKQPFLVLISTYYNVGNHIFHTVLLHLSWLLFGDSLWAIRLPVFLSGILIIPISFLALRAIYGITAAIITTVLIATSSALVEYSANSRGYEIETLLILCLFALGIYLLRHSSRFGWLLWVVLTALAFWTVPTTFYAFGGIAVWFLISLIFDPSIDKRMDIFRSFAISTLLAGLLTLLLYSPVMMMYGFGGMSSMMDGAQNQTGLALNLLASLKATWLRNIPDILHYPLLALSLLGMFFQYTISQNRSSLLLSSLLWIGVSSLFMPLYAVFTGYTRLWLTHSLFFYIAIGVGVTILCNWIFRSHKKQIQIILMTVGIFFSFLFSWYECRYQYVDNIMQDSFHDAASVANYLKSNQKPGDHIYAVCPYGSPLVYELKRLNYHPRIVVTKHRNGKEVHFAILDDSKLNSSKDLSQLRMKKKLKNERLLVVSVPSYNGFVPSGTELDEVIQGKNLKVWKKFNIRKIASFPKSDIYELNFTEMQRLGFITKVNVNTKGK